MWKFQFMGFPVAVHWWFWLTMFLLGGGASAQHSAQFVVPLLFVAAAFISIVAHELGHAVAGRKYGAYPSIYLHGFGGVTTLPGARFNRNQSMFVSFAGPLTSMLLALISFLLFPMVAKLSVQLGQLFGIMVYINIFWTILNLLPIQPLDGGQIFRDFMGPSGREITRWVGVVCAGLAAIWALNNQRVFLCMMMAYLAFLNYQETPGEGGVITH
jgi:stage IV sporulation protein FB